MNRIAGALALLGILGALACDRHQPGASTKPTPAPTPTSACAAVMPDPDVQQALPEQLVDNQRGRPYRKGDFRRQAEAVFKRRSILPGPGTSSSYKREPPSTVRFTCRARTETTGS
jgi:hypothetical protein